MDGRDACPIEGAQALALAGVVFNSPVVRIAAAAIAAPPELRAARVLDLLEVLAPMLRDPVHELARIGATRAR